MKRTLILGIGGQDGSYLTDVLLEQGYEVHGMYRHSSVDNLKRIAHIRDQVKLHQGDMSDPASVNRVIYEDRWDEVYNMADQDSVGWSFGGVGQSMDITAAAVGRTLETIHRYNSKIKFFQPVSATMFGNAPPPQSESTSFDPQSPYACAKVAAYYLCRYYRETHGMFVSTGIMYNHDSPRRNVDYLLQKICKGIVEIKAGVRSTIPLGDTGTIVDIGYARNYMKAAWQIMQLDRPDDFVIASGFSTTIHQLVRYALDDAGMDDMPVTRIVSEGFLRPGGKQPTLIGDTTKAQRAFGFKPETELAELIPMILDKWKKELNVQ